MPFALLWLVFAWESLGGPRLSITVTAERISQCARPSPSPPLAEHVTFRALPSLLYDNWELFSASRL